MSQPNWSSIDEYITSTLLPDDAVLEAALETSRKADLPDIQISPAQGMLLRILAETCGATRILEIGTLGGYSTIWLARALPASGQLVTLEADPRHAAVAEENIARAQLAAIVDVRVGAALETLPTLPDDAPFDFVFIDADKASIPEYLTWALDLARPGALIVIDNVVRAGRLLEEASDDASVLGVRRLHEMLSRERRVRATTIQTVGAKGHDGLTIARVL